MYRPIQNWQSREKKVSDNNYIVVRVPNHPKAFKGWVYEHRLVMERELGRLLKSYEEVHHITEDKTNNYINNLFCCTRQQHQRAHLRKKL